MAGLTHPDGTTAFVGDLLQHPEHVILLGGKGRAAADALSGHLGDLGTVTSVVAAAAEPRGGPSWTQRASSANGTAPATTVWSSSGQMGTPE